MKKLIKLLLSSCVFVFCQSGYANNLQVSKVYTDDTQRCVYFDTQNYKNKLITCSDKESEVIFVMDSSKNKDFAILNFSYWEKGMPRTEEVSKLFNIKTQKQIDNKLLLGESDLFSEPLMFRVDSGIEYLIMGDGHKVTIKQLYKFSKRALGNSQKLSKTKS